MCLLMCVVCVSLPLCVIVLCVCVIAVCWFLLSICCLHVVDVFVRCCLLCVVWHCVLFVVRCPCFVA